MKSAVSFIILVLFIFLYLQTVKGTDMKHESRDLEELKAKYEQSVLGIKGVSGIGVSLCKNGRTCLKIYTSIPTDQVYSCLPQELKNENIELEFIGEIKAQ